MLKHYILTSLRNIGRHRLFSAINILGLALGLASFLVIFLYVQDELRYDRHQEDSDRVYRVIEHYKKAGGGGANLPGALEGQIRGKIPQAEAIASFYRDMEVVFSHGDDKQFVEPALLFTEPEMLDILSLNLIAGDPDQALAGPFKILITPRMATKYFGEEEPVGKTLTTNHDQTYEVTGILEPLPEHSHLEIDFLASLSSIGQINPMAYSHWGFANSYFYIKLHEGANPDQAETLMNKLYVEKKGENYGQRAELQLQPLKKIYLHSSDLDYDMARHSNFKYVVGFSALALFILMIVGFNYMNLSTAR
ncbi:MAG TPA: ABC transporter permease, partial [Bacteroidales bacterium]|nr:ABC transporter permease [Bacteroidales bacterium]